MRQVRHIMLFAIIFTSLLISSRAAAISSEDFFSGSFNLRCVSGDKQQDGNGIWVLRLRVVTGLKFLLLEGWVAIRLGDKTIKVERLVKEKEKVNKMPQIPEQFAKDELKGFLRALKCKEI